MEKMLADSVWAHRRNCKDFFNCGVDVITTGNHVWDQKETNDHIEKENRLVRPKNLFEPSPGKGLEYLAKNG